MALELPNGEIAYLGTKDSEHSNEFHRATMKIHNWDFFKKSVLYGDIGFAESFLDGDWNTPSITDVIRWFLYNVDQAPNFSGTKKKMFHIDFLSLGSKALHWLRHNSIQNSRKNIEEHYDLGNPFYKLFLDNTMTYSSGYFIKPEDTLEEAQYQKVDLLLEKLHLRPSDHLLEIGSGWGFLSTRAAMKYGCKVTTITLSQEQFKFTEEKIHSMGLQGRVQVKIQDYRTLTGHYDKIVSVEMLEAVGHRYFEAYFEVCQRLLARDGILGLQVITCPDSRYEELRNGVDFIQKYIFPGSLLPSIARINQAINRTGDLVLHDLKDFGLSYAKTLRYWWESFEKNLQEVKELGYSDRFIRMWRYYLNYCEAAFGMRNISVVQMIYTRPNNLSL